jgi:low temperature requirement protein LtrA
MGRLRASIPQAGEGVTMLELFFDLVFVFTVAAGLAHAACALTLLIVLVVLLMATVLARGVRRTRAAVAGMH